MNSPVSIIWIIFGWASLGMGFLGVFLPILPTTPFILLAAFCFSKGSHRWHQWLRRHPRFGPLVTDWEEHGCIRPRAKALATVLIVLLFSYSLFLMDIPLWSKGLLVAVGLSVLGFIWSRPSHPATSG